MRYLNSHLWATWYGGDYTGIRRTRLIVCVEPGWHLWLSSHTNADNEGTLGTFARGPVRWWQRRDNSQHLRRVPNVLSLQFAQPPDTPVPTGTIRILTSLLKDSPTLEQSIPVPGGLNPRYGGRQRRPTGPYEARPDLWGRLPNEWNGILQAGAYLRTFEGYGDPEKDWRQAIDDGDVVQTGVWRIERDPVSRDGVMSLAVRGVLGPTGADQKLTSNADDGIVPRNRWPLQFARWTTTQSSTSGPTTTTTLKTDYQRSSADIVYPDKVVFIDHGGGYITSRGAPVHGHYPDWACDGNTNTFWLSEGYDTTNGPEAMPWIEFNTWGQKTTDIRITTAGDGLEFYISVMEEGAWKSSSVGGTIPYDNGDDIYTGADILYVKRTSAPSGTPTTITLPREYQAERIRLTFRRLNPTQWGPRIHRAAVREVTAMRRVPRSQSGNVGGSATLSASASRGPGNYLDYADIVKVIALWMGYWLRPDADSTGRYRTIGTPQVFGNIETTGAWSEEKLPTSMFDKKSPLDVFAELGEIVGYTTYQGMDGELHWHSRNIFQPGNRDEDGRPTTKIPLLHDAQILLGNEPALDLAPLRSKITISTNEPTQAGDDVVTTRFRPDFWSLLRGVRVPGMWVNGAFVSAAEQRRMIELTATRMWMAANPSQITCPGNPLLWIDDQARVSDRFHNVDDVYYLAGGQSDHDAVTGRYVMTFDGYLLGKAADWAVHTRPSRAPRFVGRRRYLVEEGDTWEIVIRRLQGMAGPGPVNVANVKGMNYDKVPYGTDPGDHWVAGEELYLDW